MDVVNRSRHIAGAGTQAAAWAGDPGLASVPAATLDALAPPGVGFHEDVLLVRALEQLGRASPGVRCHACSPAPASMRGRVVASGIHYWR